MPDLDDIAVLIVEALESFSVMPEGKLPELVGRWGPADSSPRLVLLKGKPDPDPLRFRGWTTGNFEEWRKESHKLSKASCLSIRKEQRNILLFRSHVGPEPTKKNYVDLMRVAAALQRQKQPCVIALSLPGAGASKPQHFHAHIRQHYHYSTIEGTQRGSYSDLLERNIQSSDSKLLENEHIVVEEIRHPIWGLRFTFPSKALDPKFRGQLIFSAIHQEVRYASQLQLSYNLYWELPAFRVTVLFRLAADECPFRRDVNVELVERALPDRASDITKGNDHWKWGWTEFAGLLQPKTPDLGSKEFDERFWSKIYDNLRLQDNLRARVQERVLSRVKQKLLKSG